MGKIEWHEKKNGVANIHKLHRDTDVQYLCDKLDRFFDEDKGKGHGIYWAVYVDGRLIRSWEE